MSGKIVIIVAPSGTGKSTLIEGLMEQYPQLEWSVSYTTRPIRPSEIHGKDYFYTDPEEFEQMIGQDSFVEWAKVHSNYYGTSKEFVDTGLKEGRFILFDLDVQGVDSFKKIYGEDAHVIFIEPPSIEELEKRLRSRGTETEAIVSERINNAKDELKRKNDYDYLVINDDIDTAKQHLIEIIGNIIGSNND